MNILKVILNMLEVPKMYKPKFSEIADFGCAASEVTELEQIKKT